MHWHSLTYLEPHEVPNCYPFVTTSPSIALVFRTLEQELAQQPTHPAQA